LLSSVALGRAALAVIVDDAGQLASVKSVLPDFLALIAHQIVPTWLVAGVRVQLVIPQLVAPAQLVI